MMILILSWIITRYINSPRRKEFIKYPIFPYRMFSNILFFNNPICFEIKRISHSYPFLCMYICIYYYMMVCLVLCAILKHIA